MSNIKIKPTPGELAVGIHEWTRESYDRCDGLNYSKIRSWDSNDSDYCPAEANYSEDFTETTEAMVFGTRLHSMVLTPDEFKYDYAIQPNFGYLLKHDKSGTTKEEGKKNKDSKLEWESLNAKKEWVTREDGLLLEKLRDSLRNHPVCGPLLELPGQREVTVLSQFEDGTWSKSLVDLAVEVPDLPAWKTLGFGPGLHLADLKTTGGSVSPWAWAQTVAKFKYHGQASYYYDNWARATGVEPVGFIFLPVSKKGMLAAAAYVMSARQIVWGQKLYRRCMEQRKKYTELGEYPGYTPKLRVMDLPEWAAEGDDFV